MPQWRGALSGKGECWWKAKWVQGPGAITPEDLSPRRKNLHRTTSGVKLEQLLSRVNWRTKIRFLIICGDTRTLLRRKFEVNSVEPVAVTGIREPLPTTIDEGVGYRGRRTCEREEG